MRIYKKKKCFNYIHRFHLHPSISVHRWLWLFHQLSSFLGMLLFQQYQWYGFYYGWINVFETLSRVYFDLLKRWKSAGRVLTLSSLIFNTWKSNSRVYPFEWTIFCSIAKKKLFNIAYYLKRERHYKKIFKIDKEREMIKGKDTKYWWGFGYQNFPNR